MTTTASYGSVHRVEMFDDFPRKARIADVVSIMNRAATEDLRATVLWPVIRKVLGRSAPPDALTGQAADLLTAWSNAGGSKLDGDLDGKIDDPGAAIIGPAWTNFANAVLTPKLGPLTDDLNSLVGRSSGMFGGGWYGYVDKDLRTLLGERVRDRYNLRYCGDGSLTACRTSLWAGLKAAVDQLSAAQGAGSHEVACGRNGGAAQVRARAALDTRCASQTGRPSSRCCASGVSTRPTGRRPKSRHPVGQSAALLAPACEDGAMQDIQISGDMIRLGQLLKLSDLGGLRGRCQGAPARRAE